MVMTGTRDTACTSDNNGVPTQQPSFISNSNTCRVDSNSHTRASEETDYISQDEVRFIAPSVRNTPTSTRVRSLLVSSRSPLIDQSQRMTRQLLKDNYNKNRIPGSPAGQAVY